MNGFYTTYECMIIHSELIRNLTVTVVLKICQCHLLIATHIPHAATCSPYSPSPHIQMPRSVRHTPSEGDVRIVRNLLRTFLPLELVDVIIADAEYWLCIHVERSKQIRVDARIALGQGFKLAWCYLVSPPIPETLSFVGQGLGQRRVRKVQLKVQGHDLVWATNLSPSSWYEATIIKASRQPGLLWLPAALQGPVDPASHLARPHFDQVFAGFTRWHIASNKLGNRTKQDHSVVWTEEEVQGPRDPGSIKGREGFGHELVRALQPGDRIAILALAQQWGWENHVYSASITIQYSV
ncbi:hypothetical protein F5879DRAFT_445763 [Lentinula edodes]|nr:hypothetical protein F5879DRAFT_445763 [Lentinula edodes]